MNKPPASQEPAEQSSQSQSRWQISSSAIVKPGTSGRSERSLFTTLRRFSRLWGFALFFLFAIILFRQIVAPFIFAFALAYLLAPIVGKMQARIGRLASVIVVYLVMLGGIAGFIVILLPGLIQDFTRLRDGAPQAIEYIDEHWIPKVSEWIDQSFANLAPEETPPPSDLQEVPIPPPKPELIIAPQADGSWRINLENLQLGVKETGSGQWLITTPNEIEADKLSETLRKLVATKGSEYTGMIYEGLRTLIGGVTSFVTKFVITLMLAVFILIDPHRILHFVRSLIPPAYRSDFQQILQEIDRGLSGVVRGQLLICAVNGVLTYIGLIIFGIKYSFLLALLAGALSLIPIFGTIISSIPILLVAFISSENGFSFAQPLMMLAWISGIHLLEANVLNPKIIGSAAHMHPIIVIFALLAGEQVYGLTGALLAVPAASIIQTLYLFALRRSGRTVRIEQAGSQPPPQEESNENLPIEPDVRP